MTVTTSNTLTVNPAAAMVPAPQPWDAGWPRQRMGYDLTDGDPDATVTMQLPSLFVGGSNQKEGDWLTFGDQELQACKHGACAVCGEPLLRVVLFGHTYTLQTNGPPVHPRCFAMALRFCPRYQRKPYDQARRIVGYAYEGDDYPSAIRLGARTALVDRASSAPADFKPSDLVGDTYDLRASKVRSLNRAACKALAKSDPLGTGATP